MFLLVLLLLAAPSYARVFVDYTEALPQRQQLSNIILITVPGRAAQAEALGYGPKEIAVRVSAAAMPSDLSKDSWKKRLAEISQKGRYMVILDLRSSTPVFRDMARKAASDNKNTTVTEEAPLVLAADTAARDTQLFRLISAVSQEQDVIVDSSLVQNPYAALLLQLSLRPKQKIDLVTWEQGRALLFPDAVFIHNEGGMAIATLNRALFRKNGAFEPKSYEGSMVLWETETTLDMMLFPGQAALWRMK